MSDSKADPIYYTCREDDILNLLCLLHEALNPKVRLHDDPRQIAEQVRIAQAKSLADIDDYVRATWPSGAEQVQKVLPYEPPTT